MATSFSLLWKQVLAPRLQPGHVVILDNLGAHQVPGVRPLIEDRGAHLLYLLPYSPDFNPIEQAWSKLQRLLRGAKSRVLEPLETRHRPRLVRYHRSQCASFLPPLWLWDTPIMKMLYSTFFRA